MPSVGCAFCTEADARRRAGKPDHQLGRLPACPTRKRAPCRRVFRNATQHHAHDDEEGFWGGLVSSIVGFFGGDSAETETDEGRDSKEKEEIGVSERHDRAQDTAAEDAQIRELAASRADVASKKPLGRRNLPRDQADRGYITPSHVYQVTADLVSEIDILRKAMHVNDSPGKAPLLKHRDPIHVFAKSLEVMEKTARFQKRLGMIPVEVGHIPVDFVSQDDLLQRIQIIIEELRRVKRQVVVNETIEPAPFIGGKTSTFTYHNLAHASLLLDGLVGRPATPNDLYLHMLRVHDEMLLVAEALGVSLDLDLPALGSGKESVAVAQQVVRAANKVINLQSKLGMDASRAPSFSLEGVTPADVLDATNFLLGEIARIKVHLDVQLSASGSRQAKDKSAADVFARVLLIIRNLDIMSKAAEDAS